MSYNDWSNLEGLPPLLYTAPLVILALVPIIFMSITSFVKFSVVFAILRNALGGNQIPSAALCGLLAIILSLYTFSPVANEVIQNIQANSPAVSQKTAKVPKKAEERQQLVNRVVLYWNAGRYPLENFLAKHAHLRERAFFATRAASFADPSAEVKCLEDIGASDSAHDSANKTIGCRFSNETIISLIPAFILSELKEGFSIGFSIFLPFLVIDLVVSNILAALGMMMVSPMAISFPLKLLLFVLSDGWYLLSKNLILGYV